MRMGKLQFSCGNRYAGGNHASLLNQYLPKDIAVTEVKKVSERFHSRFHVKSKTYQYRIWNSDISNVFEKQLVYEVTDKLDVDRMKEAALYFLANMIFVPFAPIAA